MKTKERDEIVPEAAPNAGERKMVRITPERITGVVMDAYSPALDQLRRAVAGIIRGDSGLT